MHFPAFATSCGCHILDFMVFIAFMPCSRSHVGRICARPAHAHTARRACPRPLPQICRLTRVRPARAWTRTRCATTWRTWSHVSWAARRRAAGQQQEQPAAAEEEREVAVEVAVAARRRGMCCCSAAPAAAPAATPARRRSVCTPTRWVGGSECGCCSGSADVAPGADFAVASNPLCPMLHLSHHLHPCNPLPSPRACCTNVPGLQLRFFSTKHESNPSLPPPAARRCCCCPPATRCWPAWCCPAAPAPTTSSASTAWPSEPLAAASAAAWAAARWPPAPARRRCGRPRGACWRAAACASWRGGCCRSWRRTRAP